MKRVLFIIGVAWLLSSCTTRQPIEHNYKRSQAYNIDSVHVNLDRYLMDNYPTLF